MQNLKLYFFYFKESFRLISPIQEPISNLVLIHILRSAFHFYILPMILLFTLFICTNIDKMNNVYWAYLIISLLSLFLITKSLSKKFGLILLVAYYNYYELGVKKSIKELFKLSKSYLKVKNSFIKEIIKVPEQLKEFYGTLKFYETLFSKNDLDITKVPSEAIEKWETILALEKSNKSFHFTVSWILIFFVWLIYSLPVGLYSGLKVLDTGSITITQSIGISIFLSLLVGVVEYFHNGFIKHNKMKFILYTSCKNHEGYNEVYLRVQEYYRESKVAISYKVVEDYKIEILFLACFYLCTLALSWLLSFVAMTCGFFILLLYPVLLRKLSRSRLFLGLRLVSTSKKNTSIILKSLVNLLFLMNIILLSWSIYDLILFTPTLNLLFLQFLNSQSWINLLPNVSLVPISYFFVSLILLAYLRKSGHGIKSKLIEIVNVYLMNSVFIFLIMMSYIVGIKYCLIALVFYQMSLLKIIKRGLNN
ncbi:MAG: hypothetical protein COB02_05425 [Candidatus Cloacimonadota bacterium]|nr:MAG: hypothetical protein COB02_05425 [Candidatus Cloacimonadota bacterium]